MSQVRNITARELFVPELGRTVRPDEVVTVPADRLEAFTVQKETWADATKKKGDTDGVR